MKQPSFQFYPDAWRNDPALKACSDMARLLWLELLCVMHEGNPYGTLTLPNGSKIDEKMIEKIVNFDQKNAKKISKMFQELEKNGVIKSDQNGIFYSKRMMEDFAKRSQWKERQHRKRNKIQKENHQNVTRDVTHVSRSSLSLSLIESTSSDLQELDLGKLTSSPQVKLGGSLACERNSPECHTFPTPELKPWSPLEEQVKKETTDESPLAGPVKKESPSNGSRLPRDWVPPDALLGWAKLQRPDLNLATESASFVDYWTSLPGQRGVKLDWHATFRNWIRRANPGKQPSQPVEASKPKGRTTHELLNFQEICMVGFEDFKIPTAEIEPWDEKQFSWKGEVHHARNFRGIEPQPV